MPCGIPPRRSRVSGLTGRLSGEDGEMLIVDQVKKADSHLQWVALAILGGMAILLAGLWYVQILSSKQYQDSQSVQAFRIVRVPATRGRILDRNGAVLAENQ